MLIVIEEDFIIIDLQIILCFVIIRTVCMDQYTMLMSTTILIQPKLVQISEMGMP